MASVRDRSATTGPRWPLQTWGRWVPTRQGSFLSGGPLSMRLLPGQRARGVGEPVTAARRPAELAECQVHESLLNLAFSHESPFWLVCPYDTTALDGAILEEARCSHSFVAESDQPPTASDRHVPEDARTCCEVEIWCRCPSTPSA